MIILFIGFVQCRVRFNTQYPTPRGIRIVSSDTENAEGSCILMPCCLCHNLSAVAIVDGDKLYITSAGFNVQGLAYSKFQGAIGKVIFGRYLLFLIN